MVSVQQVLNDYPEIKQQLSRISLNSQGGEIFNAFAILDNSYSPEMIQAWIKKAAPADLKDLELMLLTPVRLEDGQEFSSLPNMCDNLEVQTEDQAEYPLANDDSIQAKIKVVKTNAGLVNQLSGPVVEGMVSKMAQSNRDLILSFMEKEYDTSEGKLDEQVVLGELAKYATEVITMTPTFNLGEVAEFLTPSRMSGDLVGMFLGRLFPA